MLENRHGCIEHKGNTEEIIEQSVINVGRKYVTVSRMGMERKYSELSGGRTYITDGYNSRLFPTEQSAKEFIQKKDLVLRLRKRQIVYLRLVKNIPLMNFKKFMKSWMERI